MGCFKLSYYEQGSTLAKKPVFLLKVKTDNNDFVTVGLNQTNEANGYVFSFQAPANFPCESVKRAVKSIISKDIKQIIDVSTSRHPDYSFLDYGLSLHGLILCFI